VRLLMVSGDRQVVVSEQGPFHSLQREFSRHFERIDVICPRPPKPVTVTTIFDNVHLHPSTTGRSGMLRWIVSKGGELLAEHGASLIVSHDYGWFYNGIGSARLSARTGVPYVSEIHHVPGHPVAADLRERFDKRVARAYVKFATPRARAFRVVNHDEMPALLESWGVPRSKIAVLPSLYVDLDVFRPSDGPARFDQDVLFVGRMVSNKGLDRIVDALSALGKRGTPRTALFVGKGPLAEATRERVVKRGLGERVRFVEWVASPAELAAIYRASRVVVCASTCEGGPRFTVEAMACGTPVVSTPVGVMSELLASGACGSLAGFDVESLAASLDAVLSDEARRVRMGASAAEAARPFEYARAIARYADGLKALARGEVVRDAGPDEAARP